MELKQKFWPFDGKSRGMFKAKTMHTFAPDDASRYFSVVPLHGTMLVVWKNGTYPHAATRSQVYAAECSVFEKCFREKTQLVTSKVTTSHNLAIFNDAGTIRAAGGLLLERSPAMTFLERQNRKFVPLRGPPLQLPVKGCVERRSDRKHCELDGRLSLVRFRDRVFLYARANTNAKGGGRFVQVATTDDLASGTSWSPFHLIRFVPGNQSIYQRVLGDPKLARDRADVYFAAVKQNPVDNTTLLALLPTVIRTDDDREGYEGTGAILMAVSRDGTTFAPPEVLATAAPLAGEINDHPVDGLLVDHDLVHVFVHTGVPGTADKLCAVKKLHRTPPPSKIRRYSIPIPALSALTHRALRALDPS